MEDRNKKGYSSGEDWERDLEELGRDLQNTVQQLSQELAPLAKDVGKTVGQVSKSVGSGLKDVGKSVGSELIAGLGAAQEKMVKAGWLPPKKAKWEKRLKELKGNYEALKGTAFGLGIVSFILLAVSGMSVLDGPLSDAAPIWVLAGAFAIPAVICKVKSYPALRLMQYHRVLADRSSCKMEELAAAVGKPLPQTVREVRKMVTGGGFEGMYLAPDASRLFANHTAYQAYLAIQTTQTDALPQQTREAASQESVTAELRDFLKALQQESVPITEPSVKEQTDRLSEQTGQLIDWLQAHPESESAVKRFTGYYLPTTLKLLKTYNDVSAQDSRVSDEIQTNITGILNTINQAFQTLRDDLLKHTAMDVSAEISAMQTILRQDGLQDDGLKQ